MPNVNEMLGGGGAYAAVNVCVFGLECEVERVVNGGKNTPYFRCVQDGSLRHNGFEYTSLIPNERNQVMTAFKSLYEKDLKLSDKEDPFSERTSTHVHMNVSSMEVDHTKQLILLYALFEEFFFSLVKPCRRDNIHCVPLTETHLPAKYSGNLLDMVKSWSKYTALNLGRMHDLGTVEFRHLHGTKDPEELETWLHVLENLWKLSQRVRIDAASLSNQQEIEQWFELIFFPSNKVMMLKPSLFSIIRNSLIDVKMSIAQ